MKKNQYNYDYNYNLINLDHLRYCSNNLLLCDLPLHHDPYKDWDLWVLKKFLDENHSSLPKKPVVYDMGCGKKFAGIKFCNSYFNKNAEFFASDLLDVKFQGLNSKVTFFKGKIEESDLPDESVDLVVCLSVIEHGIDLNKFTTELQRVLKKNGLFFITTDFWPEKIKTDNLYPYGKNQPEMFIFCKDDINQLKSLFKKKSLSVHNIVDKLNKVETKIVFWERMNKRYTFTFIAGSKI